jgi:tetrahydromethanopterin S-methyltransferase subunit B
MNDNEKLKQDTIAIALKEIYEKTKKLEQENQDLKQKIIVLENRLQNIL